jgi:hypothetical protein
MSLFQGIQNPTIAHLVGEARREARMATAFMRAVGALIEEDTVEDGDGEEVVIPPHAFEDGEQEYRPFW